VGKDTLDDKESDPKKGTTWICNWVRSRPVGCYWYLNVGVWRLWTQNVNHFAIFVVCFLVYWTTFSKLHGLYFIQ